ncbi:MAG: ATP-binding cassette domain-containing protein [Candidatus Bathyarchaeia archaeon]
MPIIQLEDLAYSYAGSERKALDNVSLSVERGEFILLTGPSGCGKTTLCRCLNGLVPHFYGGQVEGKALVAGHDVLSTPIHEMARHVGFVFQSPENQLFALSVERDVAFGLENLGVPRAEIRKRVEWALIQVGMDAFRLAAPYELSGGQQQRVAIASVLAMQPEVLVLDEPTSFLDPASALRVLQLLHKLNKELLLTILLVEHRLDMASVYASRIVVMNEGRVALDGPPRSVLFLEQPRLYGVGVPRVVRLFHLLREHGVRFEHTPLTAEEAAEALRRGPLAG